MISPFHGKFENVSSQYFADNSARGKGYESCSAKTNISLDNQKGTVASFPSVVAGDVWVVTRKRWISSHRVPSAFSNGPFALTELDTCSSVCWKLTEWNSRAFLSHGLHERPSDLFRAVPTRRRLFCWSCFELRVHVDHPIWSTRTKNGWVEHGRK